MYSRTNLSHKATKFALAGLMVLMAGSALAYSGVSPKYDGRYQGALTPATDSDPRKCGAVSITEFTVRGGYVRPPAKVANTANIVFDGFVTEEGFVTGHFRTPNGPRSQFEGRMVQEGGGTLLSGGLTDDQSGCAYLMELRKIN